MSEITDELVNEAVRRVREGDFLTTFATEKQVPYALFSSAFRRKVGGIKSFKPALLKPNPQQQQMLELAAARLRPSEIASKIGVTKQAVCSCFERRGVEPKPAAREPFDRALELVLTKLYCTRDIHHATGVRSNTISHIALRHGIRLPRKSAGPIPPASEHVQQQAA